MKKTLILLLLVAGLAAMLAYSGIANNWLAPKPAPSPSKANSSANMATAMAKEATPLEPSVVMPAQPNTNVFTLHSLPDVPLALVSLSNIYPLSDRPGDSAIPDLKGKTMDELQLLTLTAKFRTRFLEQTQIDPSDRIFIYDYAQHKLASFLVKDVSVVAYLSPYADPYNDVLSQEDYMIGFGIDLSQLHGFAHPFQHALVSVGQESPFATAPLVRIPWQITTNAKPSPKSMPKQYAQQAKNKTLGDVYAYANEEHQYLVQDYLNEDAQIDLRHFWVLDKASNNLLVDQYFARLDDDAYPTPLNNVDKDFDEEAYPDIGQWTGKLLKQHPPVAFGFQAVSAGCPFMTIVAPETKDIAIKCDNRH